MSDECRAEPCIESCSVLEREAPVAREDDMRNPPQECIKGAMLGDSCTAPLTGPSKVRKRETKLGSGKKPVKKAKCEGPANHVALVLNLAMQTLESCSEILESEDLWDLIEKLEVTLRRLRLRRLTVKTSSPIEIEDDDCGKDLNDSLQRETVKTSSPIEIEDDDCDKDLTDSLISGQNNITLEKIASPDSSVKDITEVIIASQSNQESEKTQSTLEIPTNAALSPLDDNVARTGDEAVGLPTSNSDSSVNNMVHREPLIDPFSNLVIAENVPAKDRISLDLQLSMLKAGSKAIFMFLKCPFNEAVLIGSESSLKIIQGILTPEFDMYFGTKLLEWIEGVSNFVSRMKKFQAHDCVSEAELIYQRNIEKFKDAVKYAKKHLHLSLKKTIKACEISKRSKERFRDVLLDLCRVTERLDCVLRNCMSKRERRRKYLRDYVRYVMTFEGSRRDLSLAEESHTTEVLCISEKILEERKQKLSMEAQALLATMMS
ncbi:hypothetical protein FCM35_KLT08244 [Carex littledalei]|uniref:Uncharacterized protein n=1 Tax=Carex littledalei TaxID=544730 RepID=A0A833QXH6_9POAL|nr:hypothetical protein FCM35_KLT08244 [Carex littledalei]